MVASFHFLDHPFFSHWTYDACLLPLWYPYMVVLCLVNIHFSKSHGRDIILVNNDISNLNDKKELKMNKNIHGSLYCFQLHNLNEVT